MSPTVLAFPTTRKRAYSNPYVRRDSLPEGVVAMPIPRPYYTTLKQSPELLLLMAILASMEMPIRWRICTEIKKGLTRPGSEAVAADLLQLLMNLPWYTPERDQ